MRHEGYANPVTNNGPGFHSDVPIIKLTERVTRVIEASDVHSTPPVAETADGVTITKTRGGSRKVGLATKPNARSHDVGSDPREGVRAKTKNNVSKTKDASSY